MTKKELLPTTGTDVCLMLSVLRKCQGRKGLGGFFLHYPRTVGRSLRYCVTLIFLFAGKDVLLERCFIQVKLDSSDEDFILRFYVNCTNPHR